MVACRSEGQHSTAICGQVQEPWSLSARFGLTPSPPQLSRDSDPTEMDPLCIDWEMRLPNRGQGDQTDLRAITRLPKALTDAEECSKLAEEAPLILRTVPIA